MTSSGRLGAAAAQVVLAFFLGCAASAAQPIKKLVPTEADSKAPALELNDLQGRTHRLADYKGKVVLVNFWATWCEPCRDEMPSMQTLYRRFGRSSGDLVVLAVNHGENAPRIEQFLRHQPLDFPVLLDGFSEVWRAWKPGLLPASYLIGRDGRVRYRARGEIDWAGKEAEAIVRKLLNERS
jgi:peroxiredoxin